MSRRSSFTRTGQPLIVLRPRPFVPPPLLAQFWHMVGSPSSGVSLVVRANPSLDQLAMLVTVAGLVRGVLDGVWLHAMTGRLADLVVAAGQPEWYLRDAGPFLLLSILGNLLLWLLAAGVLQAGARLLGGQGTFHRTLQVTGVAILVGPLASVVNAVHLLWPHGIMGSQPGPIGIGQVLAALWLTLVSYRTARQVHGLAPEAAFFAAPLPVFITLMLYLGSTGLLLHLLG